MQTIASENSPSHHQGFFKLWGCPTGHFCGLFLDHALGNNPVNFRSAVTRFCIEEVSNWLFEHCLACDESLLAFDRANDRGSEPVPSAFTRHRAPPPRNPAHWES
jgi:hypothetical protein